MPKTDISYRTHASTLETVISNNSNNAPFIFDNSGTYDIIVRSLNACSVVNARESVITITVVSMCNNFGGRNNLGLALKVYPNPTSGELNVGIEEYKTLLRAEQSEQTEKIYYKLYDINSSGLVKQWSFNASSDITQLNVAGIKPGVYILSVEKGKYYETVKIIIQ